LPLALSEVVPRRSWPWVLGEIEDFSPSALHWGYRAVPFPPRTRMRSRGGSLRVRAFRPRARHPTLERSGGHAAQSAWLSLPTRRAGNACPLGCSWAIVLTAISADVAALVLGRVAGSSMTDYPRTVPGCGHRRPGPCLAASLIGPPRVNAGRQSWIPSAFGPGVANRSRLARQASRTLIRYSDELKCRELLAQSKW
jgi:hypothetical protein